jgi:hypothetical protein
MDVVTLLFSTYIFWIFRTLSIHYFPSLLVLLRFRSDLHHCVTILLSVVLTALLVRYLDNIKFYHLTETLLTLQYYFWWLTSLLCFSQVLAYPNLTLPTNFPIFKELLAAFSSVEGANELAADLLPRPPAGSLEHIFCGTYSYLDSLHDAGIATLCFTNYCWEFDLLHFSSALKTTS